jgi:hypothetical protein
MTQYLLPNVVGAYWSPKTAFGATLMRQIDLLHPHFKEGGLPERAEFVLRQFAHFLSEDFENHSQYPAVINLKRDADHREC